MSRGGEGETLFKPLIFLFQVVVHNFIQSNRILFHSAALQPLSPKLAESTSAFRTGQPSRHAEREQRLYNSIQRNAAE